jgi:hypothetical protein
MAVEEKPLIARRLNQATRQKAGRQGRGYIATVARKWLLVAFSLAQYYLMRCQIWRILWYQFRPQFSNIRVYKELSEYL